MQNLVDNRTLEQWRSISALEVLDMLGCYSKADTSYEPISAKKTRRYHVHANGRDWELLITGPKFWDTRANKGGGGAVDLVIHLFSTDFRGAVRLIKRVTGARTYSSTDRVGNGAEPYQAKGGIARF